MHQKIHPPFQQASLTRDKELFILDNAVFTYFKFSLFRTIAYWSLVVLTGGLAALFFYWFPRLYHKMRCVAASLHEATIVMAVDNISPTKASFIKIQTLESNIRYFTFREIRYVYEPSRDGFYVIGYPAVTLTNATTAINQEYIDYYGNNDTTFSPTPIYKLIIEQLASPFFVFQVYSIILWIFDTYYQYSIAILFVTIVSISLDVFGTHRAEKNIYRISKTSDTCWKKVNGDYVEIDAANLVPGDLIIIQDQKKIPADCLLIQGEVVVNESLLTGESIPVVRSCCTLDNMSKSSEVLAGTECIQSRNNPEAIVIRTGFRSAKGELLRQIKFPSDTKFRFVTDTLKFIAFMSVLAFTGFAWTVPSLLKIGVSNSLIAKRACDIITVCVPPALYFAMNIATAYSLNRMKKKGIDCTNSTRVNVNALVDTVVFDKTGTITESTLTLDSVIPSSMAKLQQNVVNNSADSLYESLNGTPIYTALMTCHELSMVGGHLSGDLLEIAMFSSTGATLFDGQDAQEQALLTLAQDAMTEKLESGDYRVSLPKSYDETAVSTAASTGERTDESSTILPPMQHKAVVSVVPWVVGPLIQIHTRFEFVNDLRRSSAIVSCNGKYQVLVKGALESIWELCLPQTVPSDIEAVSAKISSQGKRILAVAYKNLNHPDISRSQAESNLIFGGLLVFENPIRESSFDTIEQLQDAEINSIICTGDAALTAAAVGKALQIVDERPQLVIEYEDGRFIYSIDAKEYAAPSGLTNYNVIMTGDAFAIMLDEYLYEVETSENLVKSQSLKKIYQNDPEDIIAIYRETPLDQILDCCRVYARMSSSQKKALVEVLASRTDMLAKREAINAKKKSLPKPVTDSFVMFCGDGANDVCALKAAHTSISLSQAEASAAAPFTYSGESIDCVECAIRIGRCALVSSIQSFKFIVLYSCIQFSSLCLLYSLNCNLSDWQFLYIDLFLILPISALMSRHKSATGLSIKRPSASLVSVPVLTCVGILILVIAASQFLVFKILLTRDWYVPTEISLIEPNTYTLESTSVFLFSAYQYVGVALIMSKGGAFRSSLYKNWAFCLFIFLAVIFTVLMNFAVLPSFLIDLLEIYEIPSSWKIFLAVSAAITFALMWIVETGVRKAFNK